LLLFAARVRQQLPQARQSCEHPALDGTEGLTEAIGELRLREPAVVRELECLPLLVGKAAQRVPYLGALQAQPRLVLGHVCARLRSRLERLGAAGLLAANDVNGAAVDEGQDPRARRPAFGDEAGGRAPKGQEAVLDSVLRERRIADDSQREAVGDLAEAVVERRESAVVRARNERDERLIGEMSEISGHGDSFTTRRAQR
jgi:hypothetical protein